jgi:hypothetical protein
MHKMDALRFRTHAGLAWPPLGIDRSAHSALLLTVIAAVGAHVL